MRGRTGTFLLYLLLATWLCLTPATLAQIEVLAEHPLDPNLFTQGLEVVDGGLVLSSGLYGRSAIGRLDLETGRLVDSRHLANVFFAEGLTATEEGVWQLTWMEHTAILYDRESLEPLRFASYEGEGWGLCYDGERLYMSDGSAWLTLRDPESFVPLDRLQVTLDGQPVDRLNELEYADGAIYANVWTCDELLKIDPTTGEAVSIDLSELSARALGDQTRRDPDAGLNGIAHIEGDRFYVTGKRWPLLFEVRLP